MIHIHEYIEVREASRRKRLAGLRGWIRHLERRIAANVSDISRGFAFECYLDDNVKRLEIAKRKYAELEGDAS